MDDQKTNHNSAHAAEEQEATPIASKWYTFDEASRRLGQAQGKPVSQTWLNECIRRGLWEIEVARVREPGQKGGHSKPRYKPDDVERVAKGLKPKGMILRAESAVEFMGDSRPVAEPLSLIDRIADRLTQFGAKGPWLTIAGAADHSGLSEARIRRAVRMMLRQKHPDVVQDGGLKIRRAAVDALDAHFLQAADEEERRQEEERRKAEERRPVDPAAPLRIRAKGKAAV